MALKSPSLPRSSGVAGALRMRKLSCSHPPALPKSPTPWARISRLQRDDHKISTEPCRPKGSFLMSEVAEILDAISALEGRGENMALATIVDVRGSTYRRPGARLVMSGDGKMVGNLSGGCLEGEVQEVALSVMKDARARTAFYDLTADDEVVWGWGLGCNGAIEVFIEPADKAVEIAGALRNAIEEQRPVAVGTVLESSVPDVEPGDRLLAEREEVSGRLADDEAHARLAEVVVEALSSGVTEVRELSVRPGDLRVFIESIQPPLRLLVCGAGHDAMPLVRLAVSL